MTSINTANSSSYYTLPTASQQGSSAGSQNANTAAALTNSTSTDLLASLLDNSNASNDSSFLLDLSPSAQAALSSGSAATPTSTTFTISASQQKQINDILAKYKNAPVTQATYDEIQNALQAAGLDPATMQKIDQVNSFNPQQIFMDALNGTDPTTVTNPNTSASAESTKATNYMNSIVSQWKAESTAGTSSGSGTATSA